MIVNEIVAGIIAVVIGYLLGSTPSAYIAARLIKGKDIRQMGGGNVGTLNTFQEVGRGAGIAVGIFDIGKGTVAVAIAQWLLHVPPHFVLLAGLAAVAGHNWSIFLKFSGGKGMGTAVGLLTVLMPIYGYWLGLVIFLGIILILLIITHNVALSTGIALLFLPLITWLGTELWPFTVFTIILGLMIGLRFLPTARAAWAKSKGIKDFIRGH